MLAQTVLLIENDEDSRNILSSMLVHHGYGVTVVESGGEGLRIAPELRPDVAIVDLELPDLDACALISALHACSTTAHTRWVGMTTDTRPETRLRAMRSGCSLFFLKPMEPTELLFALRAAPVHPSFAA